MADSTDDYDQLLDDEGIQAISYEKSERVLRVFVEEKLDESELAEERLISNRVTNQETDVVEVGEIWAGDVYDPDVADVDADDAATSRHRPPAGGLSEIAASSTAATAGMLAEVVDFDRSALWHKDVEKGDTVRVSNAHVYGDMESDLENPILQPSPYDSGSQPEDFVGQTVGVVRIGDEAVDAAVRSTGEDESHAVRGLGEVPGVYRGPAESLRGRQVAKSGRTTGVTTGAVIATDATVRVRYDSSTTITKRHQILTEDMSEGGDSGSPLTLIADGGDAVAAVDEAGDLVGHIFAGSDKVSVANRAPLIEQRVGVEFKVADSQDHQPERTIEDYVEEQLVDEYGRDAVERQHRFPNGRQPDFRVFDDDHGRVECWELENDAYSLVQGMGQALVYAQSQLEYDPDAGSVVPVLCFPQGHIDEDERPLFERAGVTLREIDAPEDVSLEGV